jgi:protein O-GlcNAc transferase
MVAQQQPQRTQAGASGTAATGSAQVEECLAVAALAMEDWAAVARHCDRLSKELPDRFDVWLNLTAALLQTGQASEAVSAAQQALKLKPSSADAHLNLALALHQAGDGPEAMGHYRQAIQLGCSLPAVNWNLALLEADSGNAAVAIEMLNAFRAPDAAWARDLQAEKGSLLLLAGRYKEAVPYLEASAGPGGDWQSSFNLGIAQLRSGQAALGLQTFESIREEAESDPEYLWALAAAATAAGDGKRLSLARRALRERGETVTELTFNLGLHLEAEGRDTDAVRAYSEALKERPLFTEALVNLAHVLGRLGQEEQSLECWRRAVALKPELAEAA